jgi:hypothetical protein
VIRSATLACAALALLAGGPVRAADEKQDDSSVYGVPSEALAIEAMHNFGKCVVDQNSKAARAILAMDYRTAAYRQKITKLGKGSGYCAPGNRIKANQVLFAAGMAEALLVRDKRLSDLGRYVKLDSSLRPIVAHSPSEVVAFCVVRAAPGDVAKIFATTPSSADENKAMQAIGQEIVNCVPQGQSFRLNRAGLRALLALGAYRLAAWNAGEIRS